MAISIDAAAAGASGSGTFISYSQTLSATANLLVATTLSASPKTSISALTYGGVSYTGIITQDSFLDCRYYVAWWFNPPTGPNTLSATYGTSVGYLDLRSCSYKGVAPIAPVTNLTTVSGSVTTFNTNTITPANPNSWVIGHIEQSSTTISAGTGTTGRCIGGGDGLFDTNGPVSVATALQATCSPAAKWTAALCAFSALVTLPPAKQQFAFSQAIKQASRL